MLDDVICRGTEKSITQCKNRGWYASNCDHHEDASVRCHVPSLQGHEVSIVTYINTRARLFASISTTFGHRFKGRKEFSVSKMRSLPRGRFQIKNIIGRIRIFVGYEVSCNFWCGLKWYRYWVVENKIKRCYTYIPFGGGSPKTLTFKRKMTQFYSGICILLE